MPKILNYENFCEELDEITSLKAFRKRKFHPEGLFSEQIFGPVRNYTCQCGIYHGPSKEGSVCDICQVVITNSDIRRNKFARITLPFPVVNPIMYDLFVELAGKTLKKMVDQLMVDELSILYLDNDEFRVTNDMSVIPSGSEKWERSNAIFLLVKTIAEMLVEDNESWSVFLENIDSFLIKDVIVLPPELRPVAEKQQGSKHLVDPINLLYKYILTKKLIIEKTIIDIHRDKSLYYDYFKQIQYKVKELYTELLKKLAKKKGIIRGNILGKRIDFSGRAVIAPEPNLRLDECKLPYIMVLEIYKLPIAKKLLQLGRFKILNKAIDFVEDCINKHSFILLKLCREIVKGEYCILNRQPTLHRLGMLGFKVQVTAANVIKIHPLVCPPFNADFDGDQMAVYIPVSKEAKQEIIDKIAITAHLSSPANESLTTTPSQDIILGIYFLTTEEFSKTKYKYKGKDLLVGRAKFNQQLPDDYPIVDEVINKSRLTTILNDIKDKYSVDEVIDTLDKIKMAGFKYSTLFGCTLSLNHFLIDGIDEITNSIFSKETVREQIIAFANPDITNLLKEKFKYAYMIESGARGSWDQVKQLILARGFISNFDGEIIPAPIKHSLVHGLDQKEFFNSTYGCRKGLLDVALNTGTSGYLSRKLIFTGANLQLDPDLEDCGTTDLLDINVSSAQKARMLINRWCLNDDEEYYKITLDNYKDIINKSIQIRSPILCKSPGICKKCYGDLYKSLHSKYIGIVAAQTLGERGTQLVLRTFHTSGAAVIKGEDSDMKQHDIIGDLASVTKLLHQFEEKDYTIIVDKLFAVYSKDIYHVHYESIVAQLMWYDHQKWRLRSDRNRITPEYHSIQSVPNQESWILSMAFSNPKKAILNGIIYEGQYTGALDKILKGEYVD